MMYVVMRKEVEALVVLRKNWANILTALVVILCLGLTDIVDTADIYSGFRAVSAADPDSYPGYAGGRAGVARIFGLRRGCGSFWVQRWILV